MEKDESEIDIAELEQYLTRKFRRYADRSDDSANYYRETMDGYTAIASSLAGNLLKLKELKMKIEAEKKASEKQRPTPIKSAKMQS